MTLGDRIVVMSKGSIQQADSPLGVLPQSCQPLCGRLRRHAPVNFLGR